MSTLNERIKEFKDTWFTSWKIIYGNEWISSDQMWELKEHIQQHLGNQYALDDGKFDGFIIEKVDRGKMYYRLINWS